MIIDVDAISTAVVGMIRSLGLADDAVVVEVSVHGTVLKRQLEADGLRHVAITTVDERLADHVASALGERVVDVIVLLGALSQQPDETAAVLASTRTAIRALGGPTLVVVERNATSTATIAELLTGRTPEGGGLAAGVGSRDLERATGAAGFRPLACNDVYAEAGTVETTPYVHAAATTSSPLHQFLARVRNGADEYGEVSTFVRAYSMAPPRPMATDEVTSCFLSVVVRTQARRSSQHLVEALCCLAAQTQADLEVLVMVHDGDRQALDRVEAVVDLFDAEFASRVRVIPVDGGRVGEPLRRGLAAAHGAYAAFLDDDDHVTADWAEAFAEGARRAPGRVIRSGSGERHLRYVADPHALADWEATSEFTRWPRAPFSFVDHLHANYTPCHAFALPMATVRRLGITVDGQTAILEDWGILMRLAEVCGVHDTGRTTAVYQRWDSPDRSHWVIPPEVWTACRTIILDQFNSGPVLMPPGATRRVVELVGESHELAQRRAEPPVAPSIDTQIHHHEVEGLRVALDETEHALADQSARVEALQTRVSQFEESEWWRLVTPARFAVDRIRRSARSIVSRSGSTS